MFENLWNTIGECKSDEVTLCAVTDEDGNAVNIILQTMYKPDGSVFDKSIMAVNQRGTLYPEYSSKTVMAAIKG